MNVYAAKFAPAAAVAPPRLPLRGGYVEQRALLEHTDDKLGSFKAYTTTPTARIPEAIFTAGASISPDAWKTLIYLIHRAGLGTLENLPTRIDTADLQNYLGRRTSVMRVLGLMHELTQARLEAEGGLTNVLLPGHTDANGLHITYNLNWNWLRYNERRFAGDTTVAGRDRYAIVDMHAVRKFTKLVPLRAYLFFAHQAKLANKERWINVEWLAVMLRAPAGKKWGNVVQDHLKPTIDAVYKTAGLFIDFEVKHGPGRGCPVIAVKFTAGSRFKDTSHMYRAADELRSRPFRKAQAEFKAKLAAAVAGFDDAFLSAAKARQAEDMHADPFSKVVERVRAEALDDWQQRYRNPERRQQAIDFAFDGQLELAVMAHIDAGVADYREFKAEQDAEMAAEAAERLAAEEAYAALSPDEQLIERLVFGRGPREVHERENDPFGHAQVDDTGQALLFKAHEVHSRKRASIFNI